ncbi:hypothetical protein CHS0354_042300 [Potamilus streckersoni]|uniref:C1q domain-containing protein n=1 Tax=Potamilus streckersoni TaxID=2493646 RepID=A0AAE0SUT4_9BIVA|nr:hypothetical protein CHS0354_042300 [Potamilus streckersoni]
MQELEYRLQKAEELIQMILDGVDDNNTDYNVTPSGNAYNPTISLFTCPVSGTYLFFTSILSVPHIRTVQTELVYEGLGKGSANAFNDVDVDQGITAVALHCSAGHWVWVRCMSGSQTWEGTFSSFTGILMGPDVLATATNSY